MSCEDCKQIVELQREMAATIDTFTRRQNELFDQIDANINNIEAKHKTMLALVEQHVRDAFALIETHMRDAAARLEAAARMPPPPDKDEPPRRH